MSLKRRNGIACGLLLLAAVLWTFGYDMVQGTQGNDIAETSFATAYTATEWTAIDTENSTPTTPAEVEAVRLTATEYKILQVLMSNPGRVYSAEEIYERVWESDAYAVENTVMVHISRIREKLEINPKKPEYLKVVWGIGYVFEAP